MKRELDSLLKMGLSEEMAKIVVYAKYHKEEDVKDIIIDMKEENNEIKDELKNFISFEEMMRISSTNQLKEN